MPLHIALLEEFDLEMAFTRATLERVPEDRQDWKPQEKSMSLGMLSTFMAILVTWGRDALTLEGFDVAGEMPPLPRVGTRAERLALFDTNVAAARTAIAAASDQDLEKPWTLRAGPQVFWSRPRWLVYRTYFLNHLVHHRGQLTVYLRLLGDPYA